MPARIRMLIRAVAMIGIPFATTLATSTACRDDDLPNCFDESLKTGDRIAMRIVERIDSPAATADAAAFSCAPSIAVNVGDTIYARITSSREGNRCSGFAARLEAPSGLPSDLIPHSLGDSRADDGNEIIGSEEFQSPCAGLMSEDIRFEGASLPISIPKASDGPISATALINFFYSVGPADGSAAGSCPSSTCHAGLRVSVEVVHAQDAQP